MLAGWLLLVGVCGRPFNPFASSSVFSWMFPFQLVFILIALQHWLLVCVDVSCFVALSCSCSVACPVVVLCLVWFVSCFGKTSVGRGVPI